MQISKEIGWQVFDKMFQQTKKGKSTDDRQDLARVITLYLCLKLLMPTTGHTLSWSFLNYVDNLNNIKKYNWVEAIKDTLMNSMANANNNPSTGTVSTVNSSDHLTKKASQGHDQPQTPTKEDDKDKIISAMRAQMQEMEQKFMAELHKKEDQLKEMSTKKTGSPQQRSMVKRIKQKSRKQAHDPDFEYQPMTKPKEHATNKTQTAADVPKPTQGTNEEKQKKNDNKKQGAHEAKQQQKEKMQEHIGQEKPVAAETNPKEHANQKKTNLQVLESDDDSQEESIPNKPLTISCRKTNKVWHSLSKKDQDQIQLINNTQSTACVWSGSEDENCVYFSDICRLTNREPLYGNVIDAFSKKQLALQPTIEEFEKNDLVFASNPYAGRSYVFSTLINTPLQNQDQALREKLMDSHFPEAMKNRYIHFPINHDNHWTIVVSNQGNMLSSQEYETVIASIKEWTQQTLHSNDSAIAVCNVINQ
ncbi:uncharacterized protein LOC114305322 [Camellia sinensis]|uniref:uncharacterized protein LOC114305322 n=1 Tax=Camellia sinensis TaxID=4442 RepID=UPI001036DDD4|nr:uncharacterized protein LOC114305322 [Camellia sinensis]